MKDGYDSATCSRNPQAAPLGELRASLGVAPLRRWNLPAGWGRVAATAALAALLAAPVLAGADAERELALPEGVTSEEAMRLGERMYREGILPSGEPMRARLQGDVEFDGTMFSCSSCHLRSGMGSLEGTVITQPTTGAWLYRPLVGAEMKPESQAKVPKRLDPPPFRPAYTDALLARSMWVGKDAGGRELHWAMPRFPLARDDMAIMVHYLKNLSVEWSPGVDDTTLRFATVVSHDVSDVDRAAMVETLQAHVRDHNSQARQEERRAVSGPFYKEEKNAPYRRYALDVWELTGDRSTWPAQLESYNRERPVFALLGGLVNGSWAPVHEFSERHQIPCLFPLTDEPVLSDGDWYTMYFSRGFSQEGDTAARFLHRSEVVLADAPVVQVGRDLPGSRELMRGFTEARASVRRPAPIDRILAPEEPLDGQLLERLVAEHPGAVLVLWLEPQDPEALARLAASGSPPPAVILSESLLGEALWSLPESIRGFTYVTYPHALAEDEQRSRISVARWLEAKRLPVTNFDIQAKMYFVGWMLSGVVKKMRDDFYRDYALDIVGMMRDQYYSIAVYPRLSFGPGQRYASKGCYVVQLSPGTDPRLEKRSTWVIH